MTNLIPATSPKTSHLEGITDDFGVWQFYNYNEHKILREHGYALDDSARALIVFLLYGKKEQAQICLNYLRTSIKDAKIIGFFDEGRKSIVYPSSEDAFGLGCWALAYASTHGLPEAKEILAKIDTSPLTNSRFLRTQSYGLIFFSLEHDTTHAGLLADKIISTFDDDPDWYWFEEQMTYANAIVPYALLTYLEQNPASEKKELIESIVKKNIRTLERYQRIGAIPAPIGNRLWQKKGATGRDVYGQQPVDSAFMILLLAQAFSYFHDESYKTKATDWLEWFYGNNIMKHSMIYNQEACADGIDEVGINTHTGAESTIVFLWADQVYRGAFLSK